MTTRRTWMFYIVPLAAFLLYLRTLAPSVATLFDDSLEFHVVIPLLGVPHPPGYPLYTLLGKLWTLLIPLRDPAWRLNLFSALAATVSLFLFYRVTYAIIPRHRSVAPGVALLALAPTFWSQATIAEVYSLHMAFLAGILYLMVQLAQAATEEHVPPRALYAIALTVGFSLTHHRMTILLLPALAHLLWATRKRLPHSPRAWGMVTTFLVLPLALYLYIPLVGARVGSLDGTYRNTWPAFFEWIQARAYRIFLTENPFNVHREPIDYLRMYLTEMGGVGLLLALLGTHRARWSPVTWWTFLIALVTHLAFVVSYKVTDIDVFFLPILGLTVPFISTGLETLYTTGTSLFNWLRRHNMMPPPLAPLLTRLLLPVLAGMLMLYPLARTVHQWPRLDRSDEWGVYDLGLDMVSQPLPEGSAIVGILGETTLVRYFRDVLGYRPDLVVIPADREEERVKAIEEMLAAGREVFITRPLPPVVSRYSLDAVGPLIRVRPPEEDDTPKPAHSVEEPFTPEILLTGYEIVPRDTHSGPVIRLVLYWDVHAPPKEDLKISARLLRPDGSVAQAVDSVPVHNTYPTWAWKPGERVVDVYDIPVPSGPIGDLLVILYRAADGSEIHRVRLPR